MLDFRRWFTSHVRCLIGVVFTFACFARRPPRPAASGAVVARLLPLCPASPQPACGAVPPGAREGRRVPQRYHARTPAMAAGGTTKRWTAVDVLAASTD